MTPVEKLYQRITEWQETRGRSITVTLSRADLNELEHALRDAVNDARDTRLRETGK